jgi:hypothetical protein
MARMLKSVSLLLIGGGIGALAANVAHQSDAHVETIASSLVSMSADDASATRAPIARAQVTQFVEIGTHRTAADRTRKIDRSAKQHVRSAHHVRIAQAGGRVSDAMPPPLPRMRPILIGTGDAGSAASKAAGDGRSAEVRLAEDIQKELKRVGCYTGSIDGDWGHETRRAMKAFNDRINATLPTDKPDYILFTLLQGHAAKACGAACPRGQELSDHNKCLPRSVIAEERRRLAAEHQSASETPRAAVALATPAAENNPSARNESAGKTSASPQQEARAALEHQRIAAAEARRERAAADIAARQEAERQAQIAAAEKARTAAEVRRREEIAALAERAAKRAAEAAAPSPVPMRMKPPATTASIADSQPPPLPVRPSSDFQQRTVASASEAAPPAPHKASRHHNHRRARGARYAGQYIPPPMYRVGRMPAYYRQSVGPVYAYAPRRTRNPQRIFRELQYRMP